MQFEMNKTIIDIYRSLLAGINNGETRPGEPLPPEMLNVQGSP